MEQNPESMQYQTGGYAQYNPDFAPYTGKPGEPIMQPQYDNNAQPIPENQYEEPPVKDEELDIEIPITFAIRRGFIIKTYGILLSQLAITAFFIGLSFVKKINEYIKDPKFINSGFFFGFLVLFLVVTITVCIMFSCFRNTARRVPLNYILLLAFTLSMSFYCLIFCSLFDPEDVIVAAILTIAATIGLTVYAIKTKEDYTYLGSFLFCFIFLSIFSIAFFFWIRFTVLWLFLGVLVYSIYLIYDTQLIIGNIGNKENGYNIDDYCFAALNLYIDIIYLFIRILQIIAVIKGK